MAGNIIKVNFNTAVVKLPEIYIPEVKVISKDTILITNPNKHFKESVMTIYLNDNEYLNTDSFDYFLLVPKELQAATYIPTEEDLKNFSDIPNCSFKLTVKIKGYSSKIYKEGSFTFFIRMAVLCSNNLVCSNNLTVREYKED